MLLNVLEVLGAAFVFVLAACAAVWFGRTRVHAGASSAREPDAERTRPTG